MMARIRTRLPSAKYLTTACPKCREEFTHIRSGVEDRHEYVVSIKEPEKIVCPMCNHEFDSGTGNLMCPVDN